MLTSADWLPVSKEYDDFFVENEANENESKFEKVIELLKDPSIGYTENEHAYSGDPQKTIQQWFDNEGYDFEYKIDFENEKFRCSINLPLDGQEISVTGDEHNKKKESINNCCLKLCKVLDKAEILFSWQQN